MHALVGVDKKKKAAARAREKASRPADWSVLFDQNVDDDFKVVKEKRTNTIYNTSTTPECGLILLLPLSVIILYNNFFLDRYSS